MTRTTRRESVRMISSPTYYKVVSEIIADTLEIFDDPPYFHIGMDEESTLRLHPRKLLEPMCSSVTRPRPATHGLAPTSAAPGSRSNTATTNG